MGTDEMKPGLTFRQRLVLLLATGLGIGRAPVAPGTVGSLVGLAWAAAVAALPGSPILGPLATLAAALVAIPICGRASRLLGEKDPGSIVLDEIVAVPLVFGCGLVALADLDATTLVAGFLLFRVMDIVKPPPARRLERLPGGLGIVIDDLVAGIYAGLILWLVLEMTGGLVG